MHTKHERSTTMICTTSHGAEEPEDTMVLDDDPEVPAEPREKRQKKKKTNRPPLCTFVNYLGNQNANNTASNSTTDSNKNSTSTTQQQCKEEPTNKVLQDNHHEDKMDTEPAPTMKKECTQGLMKDSTHKTVLTMDDSSTTSVETVNTSNKSVDAMVRDDRFNFDAAVPAVDRWKEPPSPGQRQPMDTTAMMDFGGLYITSRCESDTESEDDGSPAKPREIVIRTRGRCPRLHRWQNLHNRPQSSQSQRNNNRKKQKKNSLPKFGSVPMKYKI